MLVFQALLRCRSRRARHVGRLALLAAVVLGAPKVLAQRPLTEVDREVLETRIEALERRLDRAETPAQSLRTEERRTTDEQVRRLDEKIDGRTWAFTIVIGLVLAAATLMGFLLNFVGRPAIVAWIQKTVESRTAAEVTERLSAVSIDDLVRERARPIIESVMRDVEVDARKDMAAATERHEQRLLEERDALQATANPTPEQTSTVSDLIESQKQSNPSPEKWGALDWVLRARQSSAEGHHADALVELDRALAIEPNSALALNNRGSALNRLGRHTEALDALDQALAVEPDNLAVLNNRGSALYGLGRHPEALDALDQALAVEPGDSTLLSNRGGVLNGLARHADALDALDRSIEIGPEHPAMYHHQSQAYIGLGYAEQALRSAERAAVLSDDVPDREYRRAVSIYLTAVALRLLGRETREVEEALDAALRAPFPQRLAWCVIEPTVSDDPDVQPFITRLSDKLRAHDADRTL